MFPKRFSIWLLILTLAIVVAACAPAAAPAPAPAAPVAPQQQAAPTTVPQPAPPTAAPAPTTAAAPAAKDPYKGLTAAQDAWAKAAQLGPYQPAVLDWAAIQAAAVKEGKVVIYSNSSRWPDVQKTFEAKYPGVKVEGYDISGPELLTKVKKEQQAGIYNVDVLFVGDPATRLGEMYYPPNKMEWTFVPDYFFPNVKPADVMVAADLSPLLVHHYSNSTWMYNTEVYKEPPMKNIWDLTKPEWKGRVSMKDPQTDAGVLNCFTTITQHGDDMAKAYEAAFGKPIKLDSGVSNAGFQWIKDLSRNQPVVVQGGDDVATNVGTVGQKAPPFGLASWSKIRSAVPFGGKLMFDMMWGMQPVMGCYDQAGISIANQAPHPNAAKLLIQWYMGDDKSQLGMAPYFVPGDNNPRKDVPIPQGGKSITDLGKIAWRNEADFVYANAIQIRDFWIANLNLK